MHQTGGVTNSDGRDCQACKHREWDGVGGVGDHETGLVTFDPGRDIEGEDEGEECVCECECEYYEYSTCWSCKVGKVGRTVGAVL